MSVGNEHGGARPGAGRPSGSTNKRSAALAETLISEGRCPVQALARLAERAEAEGDLATAISAWRAVAPYVHARPKPVESDPEGAIDLARAMKEAVGVDVLRPDFVEQVERYFQDKCRAA